jgi:hypothetical protein
MTRREVNHSLPKASDHINPENLDYSNVNLYISHLSNKTNKSN